MKSTFLFLALLCSSFLATAQDSTKQKNNEYQSLMNNGHSGGYGALTIMGSQFQDQGMLLVGVRGAWIVNRILGLGVDMQGIVPINKYEGIIPLEPEAKTYLVGGWGGLMLEPIIFSNKLIHATFPLVGGAGWIGYERDWTQDYNYNYELLDNSTFWYMQIGANVEMNVTRVFRLGFGISKRFVNDLDMEFAQSSDLEKINYGVTLKFGRF